MELNFWNVPPADEETALWYVDHQGVARDDDVTDAIKSAADKERRAAWAADPRSGRVIAAADGPALGKMIKRLPGNQQRFTHLALADRLASNATQHHRRLHPDGRCASCGAPETNEHMLSCGPAGQQLVAAARSTVLDSISREARDVQRSTVLDSISREARDVQLINNLHRLRAAWATARQPRLPRLPLAVRAVLSTPVTDALDAVDQGPLLGLLIGALPPALTRLLGANEQARKGP